MILLCTVKDRNNEFFGSTKSEINKDKNGNNKQISSFETGRLSQKSSSFTNY